MTKAAPRTRALALAAACLAGAALAPAASANTQAGTCSAAAEYAAAALKDAGKSDAAATLDRFSAALDDTLAGQIKEASAAYGIPASQMETQAKAERDAADKMLQSRFGGKVYTDHAQMLGNCAKLNPGLVKAGKLDAAIEEIVAVAMAG